MHKWSPDDLIPRTSPTDRDIWDHLEDPALCTPAFVEDHPTGGAISVMNRLPQDEREAVYKLVEERIREDIEKTLRDEKAVQDAIGKEVLSGLVRGLESRVEEELHRISQGAVELAIAMSEQIVRSRIEMDRDSMIGRISTIIQHVKYGAELKIIARPEDIDFLRMHMEELERMNVKQLVPNPKLSPGSCLVTSEGREWDLTVEGQIDALSEMVREAFLYDGEGPAAAGAADREESDRDASLV